MRRYLKQNAFSPLLRLALVVSLAGCVRYAPVAQGVLTHESETRYANDSLKVSLYDFSRMRFTMGSLTSADKQLLRRLPHNERVVRVLFTSHNDVRSLPSHRLLGLVRTALPAQWQRDYQPRVQSGQRPYYYRMMPGSHTDVFDCLVPNTSPALELVLEVPHNDIGGLATTQAYFLEEMDYVVQGLHTGTAYQPIPPTNPFELLGEAFGPDSTAGNYLAPVTQLHAAAENYVGLNEQGAFCQALVTAYACVDEPDSAAYYWRKMGGPLPGKATGKARPFDLLPATAEVLRQTAATSLVLFNENHVQPKGRYWVRSLLPALYQQGLRYLALEALGDDANLPQRGYPTLGSGFYLRELQLANLVRDALAMGFTLVPYDTMADDREQGQAQNLWRRSLGQDPHAKVVVLAGFGHIDERVGSSKSMARWLHELSGLNPLTINQTDLETLAPATGEEGVFFAREHDAAPPIRHYMTNDIYVVNNLNIKDKGNGVGTTQPVDISVPADSLVRDQSFALLVYARAEYRAVPNPVPVWVQIGKASRQRAFLRPGQYVTVAKNSGGTTLWRAELAVP
jgi:hypothetical protein